MSKVEQQVISIVTKQGTACAGDLVSHDIWVAVKARGYAPKFDYPPVRYHYYSGAAYELAIETHTIDGIEVKVYSVAKTVMDCFRLRKKVFVVVC